LKAGFIIMPTDPESRAKLERARDKLVAKYIYHPDVTLIDIGYPLADDQETKELVLRVHVRSQGMKSRPEQRTNFPEEMDGIPVIVMSGDYKLE
jgi:hypothetical protein